MDSPTEFSAHTLRTFSVPAPADRGTGAHVPHRAASRRHRRRRRCLRARRREDRPRDAGRLRRVPALREQHLHVPRPTTCRGPAATAWSTATARCCRAAARCAIPASAAACSAPSRTSSSTAWNMERIRARRPRAVQLRRSQRLGRAVARRRLHQLLRRPDHAARRAVAARADARAALPALINAVTLSPGRQFRIGRGDEPARAVRRRGGVDRSHDLGQHVHLLLHVGRGDRPGPRPVAARPVERPRRRSTTTCARCGRSFGRPGQKEPGMVATPYTMDDLKSVARRGQRRSRVCRRRSSPATSRATTWSTTRRCSRARAWCCASATPGTAFSPASVADFRRRRRRAGHRRRCRSTRALYKAGVDQDDLIVVARRREPDVASRRWTRCLRKHKPGDAGADPVRAPQRRRR